MYSKLCDKIISSPNHSGKRKHNIDTITIHTMGFNGTIEDCGRVFSKKDSKASSNYGIDSDGRIAGYVDEDNRSWCSSSSSNDNRAITIEVASLTSSYPWKCSDAAYQSLIKLLVDICKRNNISELKWKNDKSLIGKPELQNMTVHRWFANKACPGDYLMSIMSEIAEEVNYRMNRYHYVEDIPEGLYRDTVNKWIKDGVLSGRGKEDGKTIIDLTEDMIRCNIIAERMISNGEH